MSCIDRTIRTLRAWLGSSNAGAARRAIAATGIEPDVAAMGLRTVTEDPASAETVVAAVRAAQRHESTGPIGVDVERWLLIRQALDMLHGPAVANLGESACRLTCGEIAALVEETGDMPAMLAVEGIRFRELAKLATGRRFSAGLFHWDECGIRRSYLGKVPPADWRRVGGLLLRMGGVGPMVYPHLNPRRPSQRLEEPDISASYRAIAESIERRPELLGFFAASWLWSPDTHRVSPHLKALSQPIVENGGIVTVVGRAPLDCGVFECSATRRRLYDEGRFTPTIGLIVWPRAAMLRWWKATSPVTHGREPRAAAV
jgi:hypothetical protein